MHQITKETKRIKALVPEYNLCQDLNQQKTVTVEEALDPATFNMKPLQSKLKQQILYAYLTMCRVAEEISLLQCEMQNTTQYYTNVQHSILAAVKRFSKRQDAFGRGAVSLLHQLLGGISVQVEQCNRLLAPKTHDADDGDESDGDESDADESDGDESDGDDSDAESTDNVFC